MVRLALFLCFLPLAAFAQVKQSGQITPQHGSCWTTNGVIQDCGFQPAQGKLFSCTPLCIGAINTATGQVTCVSCSGGPSAHSVLLIGGDSTSCLLIGGDSTSCLLIGGD